MSTRDIRKDFETLTEPHQDGFIIRTVKRSGNKKYSSGYIPISYKLIGRKVRITLADDTELHGLQ